MSPRKGVRFGPLSHSVNDDDPQDTDCQQDEIQDAPLPSSAAAWVIGVLSGATHGWFMRYIESEIFKNIRTQIMSRTGIDVEWLVALCIATHSTAHHITQLASDLLEQVKSQATSSVTISAADSAIQTGIVRYMRSAATSIHEEDEISEDESTKAGTSWLSLHGQHDTRDTDGNLHPSPGSVQRFFWHENTLFMLDLAPDEHEEPRWNGQCYVPLDKMTVRCFGHSNEPILNLIGYIKAQSETSRTLDIHMVAVDVANKVETRDKRPMSTIDMEPGMRAKITQLVTDFFHPGTRTACKASGAPYRLGFLLSGPPGTGKTSLSVAIASHASVPLALINLQGMDDNDLAKAFNSLPYHCVVLLEDIDASSADVNERRRRPGNDSSRDEHKGGDGADDHEFYQSSASNSLEHTFAQAFNLHRQEQNAAMTQMRQEQEASNQAFLGLLKQYLGSNNNGVPQKPKVAPIVPPPKPVKRVTMSGLLNVIDGAASVEGRLLILTTNHPKDLDEALTRRGRCDHHFHIGYATKTTAEQTFNRIFGTDPRKQHSLSAINRFAAAFKEQFPVNSEITTAELAFYCGMYCNQPVDAVKDFAKWLEVGDEIFSYSIAALPPVAEKGTNVAEPFDENLLNYGPGDFLAAKESTQGSKKRNTDKVVRSIFNPLRLVLGSKSVAQKQVTAPPEQVLLDAKCEATTSKGELEPEFEHEDITPFAIYDLDWVSAVVERARKEEIAHSRLAGPASFNDTQSKHGMFEDDDNLQELTLAGLIRTNLPPHRTSSPPPAIPETESEEDDPLSPPLTASVKFSKEDGLKLVAPRPLEDAIVVPDQSSPTWSSGSDRCSDETDRDKPSKTSSATSLSASVSASLKSAGPSLQDLCCDEHKNDEWEDLDDDVGTMPNSVSVQLEDAGTTPEVSHSSTNVTHAAAPNLSDEEGEDEDDVFVDASE